MPQNMQKKPQVAELDLDEAIEETIEEESRQKLSDIEIAAMPVDDPRYQAALKLLQHARSPKQIASQLIKDGLMDYRGDANMLALRVQKENPQEQRTNANILFGASGVFAVIALIFIIPNVLQAGLAGVLSPALFLVAVAGWFAYKGYETMQSTA